MDVKYTNDNQQIKEIMKEFWKKKIDYSKVKKLELIPIWFYIQEDNQIVSFINGFIHDFGYYKISEITNIEVKQPFRGKGYSTALMNKFISFCKDKNTNLIYLRVDKDNQIAKKLYEKLNFKEDEEGMLMDLNLQ